MCVNSKKFGNHPADPAIEFWLVESLSWIYCWYDMAKIAVDVALLPPPEIEELAIEMNAGLREMNEPRIILDKNPCLPHATICMGTIDTADIEAIGKELRELAEKILPLELELIGTYHEGTEKEIGFSGIEIARTDPLMELHKGVVDILRRYSVGDASKEMFAQGAETDDFIPAYVSRFFEDSTGDNFFPHITVGFGKPRDLEDVQRFIGARVALCQLGNWGTCQKKLVEAEI